ncbi:MAG: glutathione S-transferase [Sneathiella sp.]|nr:MAG: glutathione S-transferase [Sneathiella sp.]
MSQALIEKQFPPSTADKIQLYTLPTPNGVKASIALEEMGLDYDTYRINIMEGDQFTEAFKAINPNSKIPAMIDPDGYGGCRVTMMESGAILLYLAEKTGQFIPSDPVEKNECIQWLFFQIGSIGPMFGQFGHFYRFAKETCKDPYPTERYKNETRRLLAVLEERLKDRDFIMGTDYTIADMAIFPWVRVLSGFYEAGEFLNVAEFEKTIAWAARCESRPATARGLTVGSAD